MLYYCVHSTVRYSEWKNRNLKNIILIRIFADFLFFRESNKYQFCVEFMQMKNMEFFFVVDFNYWCENRVIV